MSLKAKLEAVVYAAEEPVTLGQLALLFTADALEWKAEQEAAAAAQAAKAAAEAAELQPAENRELDYLALDPDLKQDPDPDTAAVALATAESDAESVAEAGPESPAEGAPPASESQKAATENADGENAEPGAEDADAAHDETAAVAALKREARQRDREVRAILRQLLDEMIATYASDDRGIEIREIAGGYRMATKPECHDVVRAFVKSLKPPLKLSLPALETLAVIAYKQPVTAPEVNEIRGVDSSGVFGSLLARKLIATAGRKPVIGRPILYKTTKEFLLRFGLKDVSELPSMEEFEKMAAAELEEPELAPQGESIADAAEDESLDLNAAADEEPEAESTPPEATPEGAPEAPPPTE